MTKEGSRNLVFDTSAIIKLVKHHPGFQNVERLTSLVESGAAKGFVSSLTFFEILTVLGQKDYDLALDIISYLENGFETLDVYGETAKKAGFKRLENIELNLSLADWIIVESAISNGYEIITSDKEWVKVKEANVKIV
jgi:PIN domain nuclease of toxin-antitoxin system